MADTRWEDLETAILRHLSAQPSPCSTAEEIAEATGISVAETVYALELLLKRNEVRTVATIQSERRWCLRGECETDRLNPGE